ncbi:leucine rich repeat gene family [Choristoneura rosaceana entomopoxvirus 'L']|uniref:Leucine rich repeat gene family n=1 Tax=Choristoneura rosaceana entomopoxvirus 'L' TaxID=1293539 RepID=A0ABM9QKL1_9POXV|nr:leucine rich repeat gene family [Choristoneura rosaceana entomopoxvirus 'L']CCU56055.1 leucine rich repeat gene family [Choristoneura rosaceana entomopoxvirus 'L']
MNKIKSICDAKHYLKYLSYTNRILFSKVQNILHYDIIKKLYIDKNDDIIDYNILKNLNNLEELYILHNNNNILNHIPTCIKVLNISNLDLQNVNFLHYLDNLIDLNISKNYRCKITEILLPKSIEILDCSACFVDNYNFIKNLSNLKILNASCNDIHNLTDNLSTTIEELVLENIYIYDCKFLEKFINLNKLNISFNKNENKISLDGIPKNIKYLNIYETNVNNLLQSIQNFPNLEKWDYAYYNLYYIDNLSHINISKFNNLKYLDLRNITINSDILLKHTKLKNIIIDFRSANPNANIELPTSTEIINICNNKNKNNYYFINDLINLKKIIIEDCILDSIISNDNNSVEAISFKAEKFNLSIYNFKCLYNFKNLKRLILDIYSEYNINKIKLPESITHITITNINLLKNINYIKNLKNLIYFEVTNLDNFDINNKQLYHINVDLSNTNIKYFKLRPYYTNYERLNIYNRIIFVLPDNIEVIEHLEYCHYPSFLQLFYKNLKRIIIYSEYVFKQNLYNFYKYTQVKIIEKDINAEIDKIIDIDSETLDI